MSNIPLKPFQEKAISDLRKQFLELWQTGNKRLPLVFKSPTGSGKTIMVAQFIRDLSGDPQFDVDKAYLWFSFSGDSYEQSKNKLFDYYGGAGEISLLDLNDLNKEKLEKNNVFFINWQKIKDSTKDGRKLRRESEHTPDNLGLFDGFIKKTQEEGRELILIIDEAHRDSETELADELIDLIDPRIIFKITATPQKEPSYTDVTHKRAGFVEVERDAVVEAGLIKEKIITQTKEDLEKVHKKEMDQDLMLLELAYAKREELKTLYKELGLDINPLVLIQLPNDDKARKETLDKSKEDIVKEYLISKKVNNLHVATWLEGKKENLEDITQNDSEVCFMVFKQAPATGWDCPRAAILVMYREIQNPIFHTQIVGRILRMPEAKHYAKPDLNIGYLYTNYARNTIQLPDNKQGKNKPYVFVSTRKKGVKAIVLESIFMGRTDYNDLGDSFQAAFNVVTNKYFGIELNDDKKTRTAKVKAKNVDLDDYTVENRLIVDAEIENYDNFVQEIREKGLDLNQETSNSDIQRMYNLLCFNSIAKQEEENKKFAPERSWGKLKTALNVWFSYTVDLPRDIYYRIILKDLLKPDSVLKIVISQALEQYRPIRRVEIHKKESRSKRVEELEIPRPSSFYTDDCEVLDQIEGVELKHCAVEPFYMAKAYNGKANELNFIKYLEAKKGKIDWWYKNGSTGSEHFSIPYENPNEQKKELFYPDWIVKLKTGKVLIVDTKGGITASEPKTKWKAEALQQWFKEKNKDKNIFKGGIVVNSSDIWKLNNSESYSYNEQLTGWKILNDLFE